MNVRFFRSRGFETILTDPRDGHRRGFYFELVVGVEAAVDPLSGMTVNLVVVDGWLNAKPWPEEALTEWEILEKARATLIPKALAAGAKLARVELRDRESTWVIDASGERTRGFRREEAREDGAGVPHPYLEEKVWRVDSRGQPTELLETRAISMDGRQAVIEART